MSTTVDSGPKNIRKRDAISTRPNISVTGGLRASKYLSEINPLNDSYFWVVSQFSNMNTSTALRCHTATTLLQGITGVVLIQIISLLLL